MDSDKPEGKMSGYLEKKGKMKVVGSYKKYWFVLEGRLLLYYRSKDEYEAISPCKGSITLGPQCTVKPCTSIVGVFQISTRSSTITLRAENMEEQNKWMQALMIALKQEKNVPQKLTHFRYSLDELTVPDSDHKKLKRQNTLPEQQSPKNSKRNIIKKLQKLGGHTYGGSLSQLTKVPLAKKELRSLSEESLSTPSHKNQKKDKVTFTESVMIENENHITSCSEESVDKMEMSSEHLYERIPSIESNVLLREKSEDACINQNGKNTVLFENDNYCGIDKTSVVPKKNLNRTEPEEIYYEPEETICDINENRLENVHSISSNSTSQNQEDIYAITPTSQSQTNLNKRENEYEDVDKFKDLRKSSASSDTSNNEVGEKVHKRARPFKSLKKRFRSKKEQPKIEENKEKVKKTASFMRRMWQKNKWRTREESSEDTLYEIVKEPDQDHNENTEKLLTDHQRISNAEETNAEPLEADEENYEDVAETTLPNQSEENKPVQNINEENSENQNSAKDINDVQNKENQALKDAMNNKEELVPALPEKSQKPKLVSPYHNIPTNNQLVSTALPPKKKNRTIDDILKDLDEQDKHLPEALKSPENSVKKLIKRFSEPETCDGEVVMRNKKSYARKYEDTDSNELGRLLDELAKVTCAPIMTPGVTSSLITPNLKDEELEKLLPIRNRRHSDPDYDIPRPHRSLVNLPKKDENALEATRFFGPILKPSDMEVKVESPRSDDCASVWLSMTPDSLEVDLHSTKTTDSHNHKVGSYNSHDYIIDTKSHSSENQLQTKTVFQDSFRLNESSTIVYAQPKRLHTVHCINDDDIYRNIKNAEVASDTESDTVFIDSLEICNELKSTAF